MSKSEEYLYRCLDVIKVDKNLSEETQLLMFVEYARLVCNEKLANIQGSCDHLWNGIINGKIVCSKCRKPINS